MHQHTESINSPNNLAPRFSQSENVARNSSVIPFDFDGAAIRVITDKLGDPWFVAHDVADALGYSKPENAVARHCKAATTTPKQGGGFMTIIPERDLYRLVMKSKLPAAEKFEEWVVGQVLPSIRKTGTFSAQGPNNSKIVGEWPTARTSPALNAPARRSLTGTWIASLNWPQRSGRPDMQYTVTINQVKALEWGLNSQQALLFAFVYGCPSWTKPIKTDDGVFFALSKAKITEELPLLTDKPDTAYRMLKALEEAGLIELSSTSNITLFRLTEKAIEWNQKLDGSEKYPTPPKNKGRKNIRSTSDKSPSKVGKKSEQGSDKSPTNQDTNHQDIDQDTSQDLQDATGKPAQSRGLVLVVDRTDTPRVEIPADMPGPKDQTCKTFKVWANYAMAYRKRYCAWPVWNAKVPQCARSSRLATSMGASPRFAWHSRTCSSSR